MKLFNEKRSDLEEQQLHLNVGLQKIRETVEQVEELQKSLSIKRNELEEKNKRCQRQTQTDGELRERERGERERERERGERERGERERER